MPCRESAAVEKRADAAESDASETVGEVPTSPDPKGLSNGEVAAPWASDLGMLYGMLVSKGDLDSLLAYAVDGAPGGAGGRSSNGLPLPADGPEAGRSKGVVCRGGAGFGSANMLSRRLLPPIEHPLECDSLTGGGVGWPRAWLLGGALQAPDAPKMLSLKSVVLLACDREESP